MDDVTVVTHLGRSHGQRCQRGRGGPPTREAAQPVLLCTLVGGTCTLVAPVAAPVYLVAALVPLVEVSVPLTAAPVQHTRQPRHLQRAGTQGAAAVSAPQVLLTGARLYKQNNIQHTGDAAHPE